MRPVLIALRPGLESAARRVLNQKLPLRRDATIPPLVDRSARDLQEGREFGHPHRPVRVEVLEKVVDLHGAPDDSALYAGCLVPCARGSSLGDVKDWVATTYAERVLAAMGWKGWGLSDLAREAGTTRGNVNHVKRAHEAGKDYRFKGPLSERVATALGVSHEWLATGKGEPVPALHRERADLSERAVYLGARFDAIESQARRDRAYALIVQLLDFPSDAVPAREPVPVEPPTGGRLRKP